MSVRKKFTRRRFVQLAAAGTGSICMLPACSGADVTWRFFTDAEAVLVDALADQIIPPDEWQGGKESGTTNFIDRQLAGPYKRYQEIYRRGLAAIQESCNALYQKRFEELPWEEQTAFLGHMESGQINWYESQGQPRTLNSGAAPSPPVGGSKGNAWTDGSDTEFFALVRDHIMQSYYGSPRHGGNRYNESYRMMGIDYPLIIGQNRYHT